MVPHVYGTALMLVKLDSLEGCILTRDFLKYIAMMSGTVCDDIFDNTSIGINCQMIIAIVSIIGYNTYYSYDHLSM